MGVRIDKYFEKRQPYLSRWRWLHRLTGIHRVHHVQYSFGWVFAPLPLLGWFDGKGIRPLVAIKSFHDCTKTGVY